MNIQQFFEISFWLTPHPGPIDIQTTIFFLVLFGSGIVGKIGLKIFGKQRKTILTKPEKKLFSKIESLCLTMGSLGLAWLFFAYENISFLSGRYFFVLWCVSLGIWIYLIWHYYDTEMRPEIAVLKEREQLEKYLPKKRGI
ncbi:hypothetical protein HYW94_00225 [Candidatus Uhrbacteria bacterium]|nr:hypothetical protein [Candidatus Uhrbacteria bacterium]